MTLAQYRQDLRKQILRLKVVNAAVRSRISVSDEEVKNYYEQVVRRTGTQRTVRASHIFIAIPEDATPKDVERKRRFAGDLVERARAGEDFAKLARTHSEDPATKEEGGDLGYFQRGSLPAAVEEIVFNMEVGEVRGPIRAARGFHIMKLLARKDEGVKPLKDVKEQLRQQLYAQEMEKATKAWLLEIRKKAHIESRL
jgi:parvulin-like peptidyl-prolyl isomerase